MRILQITPGRVPYPPVRYGGIERMIQALDREFSIAGHETVVLNGRHTVPAVDGVRGFDILQVHRGDQGFYLGLHRRPFVVTLHTPSWLGGISPAGKALFWASPEKHGPRFATATIALTWRVHQAVASGFGYVRKGPIVVIPVGVDTDLYLPSSDPDPSVAVGIGVVERRKRWEIAGRALRGTKMQFRLIGPVKDPEYAREVRESGPVRVLGEVDNETLLRELRSAWVMIHPSRSELLPAACLQAISCGVPVVADWQVTELPWGELYPQGWETWTVQGALERLNGEGAHRLASREAVRVARQFFAWPRVAERYLRLYSSLLEANGPMLP